MTVLAVRKTYSEGMLAASSRLTVLFGIAWSAAGQESNRQVERVRGAGCRA